MWHVESTEACPYTWSGRDIDKEVGHGDDHDDDDGDDADNDDNDDNDEA